MKFQPNNPGGGRPRGAKNRLAMAFLEALRADFEEHGMEAIRIARVEDPVRYVSIIAGLMPRDLQIEHQRFGELSDEELDALLEYVRQARAKLIEQSKPAGALTNGRERDRVIPC
jgi:hypothetical protein